MSDIPNITSVVNSATELLDDIRGGAITRMKAQHEQALDNFGDEKAQKLNEFNQEKAQVFAAADSQLQQRRAAVDAVLNNLAGQHSMLKHLYLDRTVHSNQSINIEEDPADVTRSKWFPVPTDESLGGHLQYPAIGKLTKVHLTRCTSGYYPVNRKFMQFVVANIEATNEQINTELAKESVKNPPMVGSATAIATVANATAINIDGLHPYSRLFARFVNHSQDGEQVNSVLTGGNASLAVDKVINYPLIEQY